MSSSLKLYFSDKSKCHIIDNIIKNMPELEDFKEPLDPKKIKTCAHNSLCFEAECGFAHTYTIEGRKKIRQAYLNAMKQNKDNSESNIKTDIHPKSPYNIFLKEQLEIIKENEKELPKDKCMTAKEKMQYVAYLWKAIKKDNSESNIKLIFIQKTQTPYNIFLRDHKNLTELLEEYRLYDPENENGCNTFEKCKFLLDSRFDALIGFRIRSLKINSRTLYNYKKELLELKELKIEQYRNKYIYFIVPEPEQTVKEKPKIDRCAEIYLEKSISEHRRRRGKERRKEEIQGQLHSLVEMPSISILFGRLMSSSSKNKK